mgnify:FL=1
MILGILVLLTALSISAVAIYYSVSGLVAIFAAAALPIMIMGGVLEIGKLVTAVWLHKYWNQAKWWLKSYLTIATVILMFITSMGIFGYLSKAHIEQTAAATEGVAQLDRIDEELVRQEAIIARAEQRILEAEASVGAGNTAIQEQIDKEQVRIDTAYTRIEPAIAEQNAIIQAARTSDSERTQPYEEQLTALDEELRRLDTQATQYESRIAQLSVDASAVDPVLAQIDSIQNSIVKVEGQLASRERDQIASAQRTIGANADGNAGPNTRRSADTWITQQRARIGELQAQVAQLRATAQSTVDTERTRLTNLVSNIRNTQTQAVKDRQLEVLATIDQVRNTESPVITKAREEVQRIRASADAQIAQSNTLIQSLRNSLTVGKDAAVEATIAEQQQKIVLANNSIDTLTEQKYTLQTEYRKLEAEVGPVKYLAEFIYGDTADKDILEEAVRWVIITIIFVFDPLAVLLLIASQATFEMRRQERLRLDSKENNNDNTSNDNKHDEHAQSGNHQDRSTGPTSEGKTSREQKAINAYALMYSDTRTGDEGSVTDRILTAEQEARRKDLEQKETDENFTQSKRQWKFDHPDQNLKFWKEQYIEGKIEKLPWEEESYVYKEDGKQKMAHHMKKMVNE